jgi:hypothetical protein
MGKTKSQLGTSDLASAVRRSNPQKTEHASEEKQTSSKKDKKTTKKDVPPFRLGKYAALEKARDDTKQKEIEDWTKKSSKAPWYTIKKAYDAANEKIDTENEKIREANKSLPKDKRKLLKPHRTFNAKLVPNILNPGPVALLLKEKSKEYRKTHPKPESKLYEMEKDENNKLVPVKDEDGKRIPRIQRDENGRPILDKNGNEAPVINKRSIYQDSFRTEALHINATWAEHVILEILHIAKTTILVNDKFPNRLTPEALLRAAATFFNVSGLKADKHVFMPWAADDIETQYERELKRINHRRDEGYPNRMAPKLPDGTYPPSKITLEQAEYYSNQELAQAHFRKTSLLRLLSTAFGPQCEIKDYTRKRLPPAHQPKAPRKASGEPASREKRSSKKRSSEETTSSSAKKRK